MLPIHRRQSIRVDHHVSKRTRAKPDVPQSLPKSLPTHYPTMGVVLPADLAEIVHAWDELDPAIRAAMLAMVRATKK